MEQNSNRYHSRRCLLNLLFASGASHKSGFYEANFEKSTMMKNCLYYHVILEIYLKSRNLDLTLNCIGLSLKAVKSNGNYLQIKQSIKIQFKSSFALIRVQKDRHYIEYVVFFLKYNKESGKLLKSILTISKFV